MKRHIVRLPGHAFVFAALLILVLPARSVAQQLEEVFQNAHIMDLSIQFDEDAGEVACLGNPDTLRVKTRDIIVFRAVGTHVNDVRWDGPENPQDRGLAQGNRKNTGRFERGRSFAIRVNPNANKRLEGYRLKVTCGDLPDAPPVIIIDP